MAFIKGDIVMKYTYIHSPTDKHLICCETHEKVYVDFPTTLELISIPNIVETREREAIERYELLKEVLK